MSMLGLEAVPCNDISCTMKGSEVFYTMFFEGSEAFYTTLFEALLPAQTQNYWSLISMWLMDPFVLLQAKRSNTEISIPALGLSPNIGLVLVEKSYEGKLSAFRKTGSFAGSRLPVHGFPHCFRVQEFLLLVHWPLLPSLLNSPSTA